MRPYYEVSVALALGSSSYTNGEDRDGGRMGGRKKRREGKKERKEGRKGRMKDGGREEGIAGLYPRLPLLAHLLPSPPAEARERAFSLGRTPFTLVVHMSVRGTAWEEQGILFFFLHRFPLTLLIYTQGREWNLSPKCSRSFLWTTSSQIVT